MFDHFKRSTTLTSAVHSLTLLTKIFGSAGRARILDMLISEGPQMLSDIARRAKVSNQDARKYMNFFIDLRIVEERKVGRRKVFGFVDRNEISIKIRQTIKIWSE